METVFHVLSAIPVVANRTKDAIVATKEAVQAMKDALYTVKVLPPKDNKVYTDLSKLGITTFNKRCQQFSVKGIKNSDMPKLLDRMADDFEGIDHKTRAKMSGYMYGQQWSHAVMEVKYTPESANDAIYLMITIELMKDGLYNLSYVACTIDFELNERTAAEIRREILFGIFTSTKQVEGREAIQISTEVIKELEDFIRYLVTKEFEEATRSRVVAAINGA